MRRNIVFLLVFGLIIAPVLERIFYLIRKKMIKGEIEVEGYAEYTEPLGKKLPKKKIEKFKATVGYKGIVLLFFRFWAPFENVVYLRWDWVSSWRESPDVNSVIIETIAKTNMNTLGLKWRTENEKRKLIGIFSRFKPK